ncbi:ABC transporter permease [Arenimonas caeni]|jgi:putative ABC transport system permease protein|uniref:ABC transporter permease n=1 Tax=Arenimonas caeni TaxID=2058085 RepID=A0A2P6M6U3_9GAMM|nr:ABC transporter permease [Arenimonas caeni]MDY0021988.1 ABC transporter permease [Arenimonas caeni]PRH81696.1 ABC transporter permease [Arenimonas caeni]
MFRYYLGLGFRSLRRNPVLTALMVLTLSVGVAASMTTLTILRGMSGDPIPGKSDLLFVPLLDNRPVGNGPGTDPEPPEQLTLRDALALWEAGEGVRRTPLYGVSPPIDSGRPDLPPFFSDGLAVGRDFFTMFEVPFLHGQAWTEADDQRGAQVAVISRGLAERIYGEGVNPVGQVIRARDEEFQVIGVVDDWNPVPKFYRLVGSRSFDTSEDIYIPVRAAIAREFQVNGNVSCNSTPPSPGFRGLVEGECNWVQYWVELGSAGERGRHADYLDAYVAEQKALGRFEAPLNNRLYDVREWLDVREVVSDDTRTSTWLSFGFLLVCLVNTVGLLLAKFSARPGEIGVRRALGASRGEIFRQYLTEAAVIGLVGAGVGIALTFGALAFIRGFNDGLAQLTHLDAPMATVAVLVSVVSAVVAGLLPTWRACQVVPALQLKSQ